MNKTLKSNIMEKEEKYSISKEITKNGITKRLTIDEVENGFIICINKYGCKTNEDGEKEHFDSYKKYISKTNPLEKKEDVDEENTSSEIMEALNNLNI